VVALCIVEVMRGGWLIGNCVGEARVGKRVATKQIGMGYFSSVSDRHLRPSKPRRREYKV
jgi:hypothetical protein